MSQLTIDRSHQLSLIEEVWLEGKLGADSVSIRAKVYRCDAGNWQGQFGVDACVATAGIMTGPRPPKVERFVWGTTKEAAIQAALAKLESENGIKL